MTTQCQFSSLLIVAGGLIFFAVGELLYLHGEYDLLTWLVLLSSSMVLFGGLQWHMLGTPRPDAAKPENTGRTRGSERPLLRPFQRRRGPPLRRAAQARGSFRTGLYVSGVVSLFLFACTSLLMLAFIFMKLNVNASYRVHFTQPDVPSPRMVTGTLEGNGMRFSILRAKHKAGKFSVMLRIGTGSLSDPPGRIGLAALSQRVSLDSSNLFPSRYGLYSAFQSLGAKIDHRNTYTLPRSTVFLFTDIPASLKNLEMTLTLLKEVTLSQRPVESQVNLEKRVLRGEWLSRQTRARLVANLVTCSHFGPRGPICERLSNEYHDMANIDAPSVETFFRQHYQPSAFSLRVAGDLEFGAVSDAISRVFESVSRKPHSIHHLNHPPSHLSPNYPQPRFTSNNQDARERAQGYAREKRRTPRSGESSGDRLGESAVPVPHPGGDRLGGSAVPVPHPEPLTISTRPGFNGLAFSLVVSAPFLEIPNANFHRRQVLSRAFYVALLNAYMARNLEEADRDSEVELFASVTNSFELSRQFHKVSLQLGGHPEKGGWRRAIETFLLELRRLAETGPDRKFVARTLQVARVVLQARKAFSSYEDSAETVTQTLLQHTNPNFIYQDPVQEYETAAPFCNQGFSESAAAYVQAEAQLLFKHLVQCVNKSARFTRPPYDDIAALPASVHIITDPVSRREGPPTIDQSDDDDEARVRNPARDSSPTPASYITHASLARIVNRVLDAVLVPAARATRPVIHIEDIFMRGSAPNENWVAPWGGQGIHAADVPGSEPVVEMRYLHTHMSSYVGQDLLAMDGLPSSGKLVDVSRPWVLVPVDKAKNSADEATDPVKKDNATTTELSGLPTPHAYMGPGYRFVDAFPASGVQRYRLTNGLRVNLKQRLSGDSHLPSDAPGLVWIEVVSLGGRATQPPALMGACELVELNVPSGFAVEYWAPFTSPPRLTRKIYDTHTVDQYTARTGRPRLSCQQEAFTLRKRLHPKCVNYPSVASNCNPRQHDYLKKLEAVRLAMSPVFDARSVEQAAQLLEKNLVLAQRFSEPVQYLNWRVGWELQTAWHAQGATDPRLGRVSPTHIKRLDPTRVGAWVREQFTVDRMEVNVVGDFDDKLLLEQLDRVLGTMPLSLPLERKRARAPPPPPLKKRDLPLQATLGPQTARNHTAAVAAAHPPHQWRERQRIGYDVYNAEHQKYFKLSRNVSDYVVARSLLKKPPASRERHTTTSNCSLPGLFPHRAFISMAVLMNSDFTAVRGHLKAILADHLFKHTILNVLRRDNGYVSTVDSVPFNSRLFRNLGYYRLQWCVGLEQHGVDAVEEKKIETDNDSGDARINNLMDMKKKISVENKTLHRQTLHRHHRTPESTNAGSQPSTRDQVQASIRAIHDMFAPDSISQPFERSTFLISKSFLLSELESRLQETPVWLSVMQGISLAPPAWFHRHRDEYPTIKDIAQTDVLRSVESLSHSEINDWFSQHLTGSTGKSFYLPPQISIGIVEATEGDKSHMMAPPCKW